VYNGAATIGQCLESLAGQTYPADKYEIIVVENGSTDGTTRVVEQYPVRIYHCGQRGPAPARNLGIDRSEGEIVAFTDADCVADREWLAELVKPYGDLAVGATGGAILAYASAGCGLVERFSAECTPLVNYISGEGEFLPRLLTANASYRKDLLKAVGGFDARLVTAEDVDLAWRVQLQMGAMVSFAPQAIVYHHHRRTRAGLARQYRQYGFSEILLDTMYGRYTGYPRTRRYQARRMVKQLAALGRYGLSAVIRQARLARGKASTDQAAAPRLWFLIESNNLWGKLEAIVATRLMTDASPVLQIKPEALIERWHPGRVE
jgi:glycosyltransferase involved in cell wall biosynthesis